MNAWANLTPFSLKSYVPAGPPSGGMIVCGSYSHPDFGCSDESRDITHAYLQAQLWAIDGTVAYKDNAIAILNLYVSSRATCRCL
jgi:hypothetical protein